MFKKIKKISALMLALLMVLTFAACNAADNGAAGDKGVNEETMTEAQRAYSRYNTLAQAMSFDGKKDVEFDADIFMLVDVNMAGQEMNLETTGNMKVKIVDGKQQCEMVMDMGKMGSMEMYSDGEKVIYKVNGKDVEMSMADIDKQLKESMDLPKFEEGAIKSSNIEKVGKDTKYNFIVDGKMLSDFAGSAMEQLGEGDEMNFSDMNMYYIIDSDNKPLEMYINVAVSGSSQGQNISMDMTMKYFFNKYGSGVSLNFPS